MVRAINLHEKLINELFSEAHPKERCPHITKDEQGPYCAKNLRANEKISEQRRMVCDVYSLQLWCLHSSDYERCIYFKEGFETF